MSKQDKSWPDGPWDNESDFETWITRSGLRGVAVRGPLGAWNGYVLVNHKGLIPGFDPETLKVHGGVTWYGGKLTFPELGKVYAIGFDCAHHGDQCPGQRGGTYRTIEYVQTEVESLASQIFRQFVLPQLPENLQQEYTRVGRDSRKQGREVIRDYLLETGMIDNPMSGAISTGRGGYFYEDISNSKIGPYRTEQEALAAWKDYIVPVLTSALMVMSSELADAGKKADASQAWDLSSRKFLRSEGGIEIALDFLEQHSKKWARLRNNPRTKARSSGRRCQWCNDLSGNCDCAERVNCPTPGIPGHMHCGRCSCGLPRFECNQHPVVQPEMRDNPSVPADAVKAHKSYEMFHQLGYKRVSYPNIPLPDTVYLIGKANVTYYRSDKWENKSHDYKHDHDGGVNVAFSKLPSEGVKYRAVALPRFMHNAESLWLIGESLGFEWTGLDNTHGKAEVAIPRPKLYAFPNCKGLIVIVPGSHMIFFWGGHMNVQDRGIVG